MTICLQTQIEELDQIKYLQEQNLKSNLDPIEQKEEGFLTASYTFQFLSWMNNKNPAILAKVDDEVVGYALVATSDIRGHHNLLDDLIGHCNRVVYKGITLAKIPYAIVGQLCVSKAYRGQGVVQKLYAHFRQTMDSKYLCCITDVDRKNPRSLKAHLKAGFEVVGNFEYEGAQWDLVLWNWKM